MLGPARATWSDIVSLPVDLFTDVTKVSVRHSLPVSLLTPRVLTGNVSRRKIVFVYNSLLSVYAGGRWTGGLQTEIVRKLLSTSDFLLSPSLLQTFTQTLAPLAPPIGANLRGKMEESLESNDEAPPKRRHRLGLCHSHVTCPIRALTTVASWTGAPAPARALPVSPTAKL